MYSFTSKLWDQIEKVDGFKDIGVITISYEWSEKNVCKQPSGDANPECTENNPIWTSSEYIDHTDINFMKFGAYGITTVVSSGDDGCLGNFGQPDIENHQKSLFGIFDPQ